MRRFFFFFYQRCTNHSLIVLLFDWVPIKNAGNSKKKKGEVLRTLKKGLKLVCLKMLAKFESRKKKNLEHGVC